MNRDQQDGQQSQEGQKGNKDGQKHKDGNGQQARPDQLGDPKHDAKHDKDQKMPGHDGQSTHKQGGSERGGSDSKTQR